MRQHEMQVRASQLHVGVIGLGVIAEEHLQCYQQLPGVPVIALAGLEPDRLSELKERYRVPHTYRDYQELLAREDVDAISICVPNHLHAPIALAALERGKHVLSEKPLARSAAEAERMIRAAEQADRALHVVFNHRYRGDVQLLKRYLDEGQLGRIYQLEASWLRSAGIPSLGSWFTSKEMAGGGPLIDLGLHMLDMALYLLGEPDVVSVSASTYAELGPRGLGGRYGIQKMTTGSSFEVEDLATAFIRLAGGVTLLLQASWAVHGKADNDLSLMLYGTDGGAELHSHSSAWQNTLRLYFERFDTPHEVRPHVGRGERHLAVLRNFVAAIRHGDHRSRPAHEALQRARIIDACYTSAQEQREVLLTPQ